MKNRFGSIAVAIVMLMMFSFPASAAEFKADEGDYSGWGVIYKSHGGFSAITNSWRDYPEHPKSQHYYFYPGNLIAQQNLKHTDGYISYVSASEGKVHLSKRVTWYRNTYQQDLIELRVGEKTIIGSIMPRFSSADKAVIIIKLINLEESGKAIFEISLTQNNK